jgi:hypothetical protein
MMYDVMKENAKEKWLNNLLLQQIERLSTKTIQRYVTDYKLINRKLKKYIKQEKLYYVNFTIYLAWSYI